MGVGLLEQLAGIVKGTREEVGQPGAGVGVDHRNGGRQPRRLVPLARGGRIVDDREVVRGPDGGGGELAELVVAV